MSRKQRKAGSLEFDHKSGEWRDTGGRVSHITLEETRRRSVTDGFHAGFIVGTQIGFVITAVLAIIGELMF